MKYEHKLRVHTTFIGAINVSHTKGLIITQFATASYLLDVLWCQPIKLIHIVSTSEFHEY